MNFTKRILNNAFWLVLSEAGSRGLIFLGTVYLARVLGKAGFGLYSLSLAVGVYFWVIADLGIIGYGTREIAKNKGETTELYSILNSLRFFLALGILLIFSGTLYLINMPAEKKLILLAGAFYSVCYSLSGDWVLRGLEKMQYIMFGRLFTALFFIGGIYFFVKNSSDIIFAAFIYPTSFLIGSFAFLYILHKKFKIPFAFRISFSKWRVHVKESFYFAINGAFNSIAIFIPLFFMGLWSTSEDIGAFSAPHRLTIFLFRISGLVLLGLYPTLSSLYNTNREDFKKAQIRFQQLVIAISMPLCVICTIFGKDIIIFLFSRSYSDSGEIFSILIWLTFIAVIRRSISIALLSAGYHRFNMIATGAGVLAIIMTGLVLIPNYSSYGAALALIIGEVLTVIIMNGLFRQKVYRADFFTSYFFKVLLASAVTGMVISKLPFYLILNIFIGILVYGFISIIIGIVSKKTIQQFYHNMIKQ